MAVSPKAAHMRKHGIHPDTIGPATDRFELRASIDSMRKLIDQLLEPSQRKDVDPVR
jgi:hypothetical protein